MAVWDQDDWRSKLEARSSKTRDDTDLGRKSTTVPRLVGLRPGAGYLATQSKKDARVQTPAPGEASQ